MKIFIPSMTIIDEDGHYTYIRDTTLEISFNDFLSYIQTPSNAPRINPKVKPPKTQLC